MKVISKAYEKVHKNGNLALRDSPTARSRSRRGLTLREGVPGHSVAPLRRRPHYRSVAAFAAAGVVRDLSINQ